MALLRNEPIEVRRLPGCQSAALGLLLAAPFTALTGLVMDSVVAGIVVLVCIVIGIAMLGGFFSGILWVCTHLLPLRGFPLVRMASNSLQRRGVALVFAMIALFVGVLSMSMAMAVTQISERQISGRSVDFQGYNLNVLATAGQENAIRQAVQAQNPEQVGVGYRTALAGLNVVGGRPVSAMDAVLVGRSDPQDYVVSFADPGSGADWGSRPDGVYAYKGRTWKPAARWKPPSSMAPPKFSRWSGHTTSIFTRLDLYPPTGLLMTAAAFTRVAQARFAHLFRTGRPDQAQPCGGRLGSRPAPGHGPQSGSLRGPLHAKLPEAVFPGARHGWAGAAGRLLLVANSVSLAMLERRYEIGILKTVGYSRRQILSIFAVEYGLVGLLATATGMLLIQVLLAVLAVANHLAASVLLLNVRSLVLIAFCGVGLTLLTVFGVTWDPTRVPPVVVLNERN